MYVAVEGCSHGELDRIYETILQCQQEQGVKIDLLICCGDFQSVRNIADLRCMAVPTKYMNMQSFYKYYSGERKAPVLTIFIGGNHEASNYLQELPYGGWVAPNIYFLGNGGVVNVGGLRIGGVSGIYKGHDYIKGKHEFTPYNQSTVRSVYHVRNLEVFRTKQLTSTKNQPVDIFLSHDWPKGVTNHGDAAGLCRKKKFFTEEVRSNTLGSRAAEEMLDSIRPRYWFAGHLHVKFVAVVEHEKKNVEDEEKLAFTRFLALDKCLGNRDFLQIVDIKPNCRSVAYSDKNELEKPKRVKLAESHEVDVYDEDGNLNLYHDLEWLTILRLTNHLTKVTSNSVYMPGPGASSERHNFNPSSEEMAETLSMMADDLLIKPGAFIKTASAFNSATDSHHLRNMDLVPFPDVVINPYTEELCDKLGLDDPVVLLTNPVRSKSNKPSYGNKDSCNTSSKPFVQKQKIESSQDISSGDIVFEISISSNADGSSVGQLKSSFEETSQESSIEEPVPTPCVVSSSRKSLKLSAPSKTPTSNKNLEYSSIDHSASSFAASLEASAKTLHTPNTEESTSSSPKRSLDQDETCNIDSNVNQISKKACKIKRRNVSVYSTSSD